MAPGHGGSSSTVAVGCNEVVTALVGAKGGSSISIGITGKPNNFTA
jgi:hypothetical protein